MNENSILCKFLAEHPNDWEDRLKREYDLKIKKEGNYAIFNYNICCNFYDAIVQEARGIIIDYVNLEVVCWPFRKFGNHHEGYADEIDWESARVLEKVDGSIVKLWYDKEKEKWQFSTNGKIRAEEAPVENTVCLTYGDVISSADNAKDIPYDKLNKDFTYIFELVSPETRVVVKYEKASLYHLGTRNNKTGEEMEIDISIKKPKSYPLSSLENCLNAARELNKKDLTDDVGAEGFVVVDKNWHRVKIKSPDYIMMHHLSTMKDMTKKECVQILLCERERLDLIFENCESVIPVIKYYDYKIAEVLHSADLLCTLTKRLYEEYNHDRKAVAKVICKHPLSAIGFKSINSEKSGREIMLNLPFDKFCKFIPDYHQEDLSWLFTE